jgi:outer membrane protein assembly factor BamE (lipoprotein component of BamABCDE complex)
MGIPARFLLPARMVELMADAVSALQRYLAGPVLGSSLLLAGCGGVFLDAPNLPAMPSLPTLPGETINRGYVADEDQLRQIKPGTDAQAILKELGSPSTVSTVGNQSWYYVSQTMVRRAAFLNPTVVDRRVVAVYFNKNLKVERVALYGLEDGKVFDFISRTTPTGGTEQSFVGNLLRGLTHMSPF